MTNDTQKKSDDQNATSSERLAACSLISGALALICSFLYLPLSLGSGNSYPGALVCSAIGITLALMSRNADMSPQRTFKPRARTGIILSSIAIGLTFFFFYSLVSYYDALTDPVLGPQINSLINQLQEQMNLQL